jgi:hypothetical protein
MGWYYEAQGEEEFRWACDVWAPRPKGGSGRVVVKLAPWWWRLGRAIGLPLALRWGMRSSWPSEER